MDLCPAQEELTSSAGPSEASATIPKSGIAHCPCAWASPVAYMVKNLPSLQETWVRSLAWEVPCEGNVHPLQYSCLENSMDRGACKESDVTERLTLALFHTVQESEVQV